MKYVDLLTMMELAQLRNREPEEYKTILSSIKEVFKDIAKLELEIKAEITAEIEADIEEKKKKEKEELDLRIAEKMKRDK